MMNEPGESSHETDESYGNTDELINDDVQIDELSIPERFPESDIQKRHPAFEDTSGGYLGAVKRSLTGIPPVVWVENHPDEVITVVISKSKACHATSAVAIDVCLLINTSPLSLQHNNMLITTPETKRSPPSTKQQ